MSTRGASPTPQDMVKQNLVHSVLVCKHLCFYPNDSSATYAGQASTAEQHPHSVRGSSKTQAAWTCEFEGTNIATVHNHGHMGRGAWCLHAP